jgi:hypothetical protein
MGSKLVEKESRNEKVDREKWSILECLDRLIPFLFFPSFFEPKSASEEAHRAVASPAICLMLHHYEIDHFVTPNCVPPSMRTAIAGICSSYHYKRQAFSNAAFTTHTLLITLKSLSSGM